MSLWPCEAKAMRSHCDSVAILAISFGGLPKAKSVVTRKPVARISSARAAR